MSIQENYNEALHDDGDFSDCKETLLRGVILKSICDSLDKILCPKPLSYYRQKKQEECEDGFLQDLNADELWAKIAQKICRLLICINQSESICKLLLELGVILNEKLQVSPELRCIAKDIVANNCFLNILKLSVDQAFPENIHPGCDESCP